MAALFCQKDVTTLQIAVSRGKGYAMQDITWLLRYIPLKKTVLIGEIIRFVTSLRLLETPEAGSSVSTLPQNHLAGSRGQ